jgi:hypothetical protein
MLEKTISQWDGQWTLLLSQETMTVHHLDKVLRCREAVARHPDAKRFTAIAIWAATMIGCATHPVDPARKKAVPSLPALATPFKVDYTLCGKVDDIVEASSPGDAECPGHREILRDLLGPVMQGRRVYGIVRLVITVEENRILDVRAVSGPAEYQWPAVNAAYRLKCFAGSRKLVKLRLDVEFRPSCTVPLLQR